MVRVQPFFSGWRRRPRCGRSRADAVSCLRFAKLSGELGHNKHRKFRFYLSYHVSYGVRGLGSPRPGPPPLRQDYDELSFRHYDAIALDLERLQVKPSCCSNSPAEL